MEYQLILFLVMLYLLCGYFFGTHKALQLMRNYRIAQLKFVSNYSASDILQLELKKIGMKVTASLLCYTLAVGMIVWTLSLYNANYRLWKYQLFLLTVWKISTDIFIRKGTGLEWYKEDKHNRISYFLSSWITKAIGLTAGTLLFLFL